MSDFVISKVSSSLNPTATGFNNSKSRVSIEQPRDEVCLSTKNQKPTLRQILSKKFIEKIQSSMSVKMSLEELKSVQEKFQQLFMRDDISLEDTKIMINEYKEAEKIKDRKEYAKAIFELAKKNYGFGDIELPMSFMEGEIIKGGRIDGKAHSDISLVEINPESKKVCANIHHELRHIKQHYYSACMDSQKYVQYTIVSAIRNAENKGIIPKGRVNTEKVDSAVAKDFIDKITRRWGELLSEKVPQKYKVWASIMLDTEKDYVSGEFDKNAYEDHLHEKDANLAGALITKIMETIKFKTV